MYICLWMCCLVVHKRVLVVLVMLIVTSSIHFEIIYILYVVYTFNSLKNASENLLGSKEQLVSQNVNDDDGVHRVVELVLFLFALLASCILSALVISTLGFRVSFLLLDVSTFASENSSRRETEAKKSNNNKNGAKTKSF